MANVTRESKTQKPAVAKHASHDLADADLQQRLAERTIERDDAAREEAVTELARTNAELRKRLAERTIERDDVARDEALAELARTNDEAVTQRARTNTELQKRLAERTIERDDVAREKADAELVRTNLAEELLHRHASELEELNRELESFSYSISHDLRAPVRAITGFARMIEEDYGSKLDDEGRRLLSVVRSEAARMAELIDDLLEFSRLGRQPLRTTLVDMTALVRQVVDEEKERAGETRLTVDLSPLPPVYGDPRLLRQVWSNLVSNAIKYSSKSDAPRVTIRGTTAESEFVYQIEDNGIGFDMQFYDKLFGVFQRLHSADEYPGTGIGLAVLRRIVVRHGGRAWAQSTPGEGTTFFVALPSAVGI